MSKFVLVPIRTAADLQMFQDTVDQQVDLASLKSTLFNKLYDHIYSAHPNKKLSMWGFQRGHRSSEANKWNRIIENDVVVFIANGSLAGYSHVKAKFQSESVARIIWPDLIDEDFRQYIVTFNIITRVDDGIKLKFEEAILKSNFDLDIFQVYDNSVSLELLKLLETATSSSQFSSNSQAFGLSAAERKVVEKHAVETAIAYLGQTSFSHIEDVGDFESFDIKAKKGGVDFIFEVKGTTGDGSTVILTRNEVSVQNEAFPNNGLILVKNIELNRIGILSASDGDLVLKSPWRIEPEKLTPISYEYII